MTMFIGSRDDNDIMRDLFIHDARIGDRIITMTAQSGEFIERDGSPTLDFAEMASDPSAMPKAKVALSCCLTRIQ